MQLDKISAGDNAAGTAFSWAEFSGTDSPAVFARHWLTQLSSALPATSSAVVMMLRSETGKLIPAAHMPLDTPVNTRLNAVVEAALQRQQAVVLSPKEGSDPQYAQLCYPILLGSKPVALVAIEVPAAEPQELELRMRTLRWHSGWLELFYRKRGAAGDEEQEEHLLRVLNALASALEHESLRAAAVALVNELGSQLQCTRVSLGLLEKGFSRVQAMSNTTEFAGKAELLRSMGCAMDEALDQQASVPYPTGSESALLLNDGQRSLAELDPDMPQAVVSVPLPGGENYIGAIVLERGAQRAFTEAEIEHLELVAAMLGPALEDKQRAGRSWLRVAVDSGRRQAQRLFGKRYYGRKLVACAVAAFLLVTSLYPADYRVTADAKLESTIRRAIVAPVDGFVESAQVRAGDLLRAGDELYALDERDLKLEQLRWNSEKVQLQRQLRDALAAREAATVRVIEAQLEQADAQLTLVNEQLGRMRGRAPFDGYVISGDLSQSLGAPVSRGDILFEIAPLDAYRVVLFVGEEDVNDIDLEQAGSVVLRSGSESALPFTVERIIPLSEPWQGANVFRVEARLAELPEYLRPGMEGVGKIEAGSRSLIWIWTHNFTRWMRLWLWEWF